MVGLSVWIVELEMDFQFRFGTNYFKRDELYYFYYESIKVKYTKTTV